MKTIEYDEECTIFLFFGKTVYELIPIVFKESTITIRILKL